MIAVFLLAVALPAGRPAIVVPMYTRCPNACLTITRTVRKAAAAASAAPSSYNVVLFSFDPRDRQEDMAAFAKRERVPANWILLTAARPGEIRDFMDRMGYRTMQSNGGFVHPAVVGIFTAGGDFVRVVPANGLDLDDALAIARGGSAWLDRWGGHALAVVLLLCTLSAVYLFAPHRVRNSATFSP